MTFFFNNLDRSEAFENYLVEKLGHIKNMNEEFRITISLNRYKYKIKAVSHGKNVFEASNKDLYFAADELYHRMKKYYSSHKKYHRAG